MRRKFNSSRLTERYPVDQRRIFFHFMVILILSLTLSGTALSENPDVDKSLKSYKLPADIKKYLQAKYPASDGKDQITEVQSNLQETPQGPRGSLSIKGHIKIRHSAATSGDKATRARSIAMTFLKDEAVLLGLPDMNEIHEHYFNKSILHNVEYTQIGYSRITGNYRLLGVSINITIGPDELIHSVYASLHPGPTELYQAARKLTITKEEVLQIIAQDLEKNGMEPRMNDATKWAIDKSPYVIWTVRAELKNKYYGFNYKIDAFTGDIIEKKKFFNCFAGSTPVLMADGSLIKIEEIKQGDYVASYDFENARRVSSAVSKITASDSASYLIIDGLKVTEHHPFAIGPDQWVEAGNLRAGGRVVGLNGEFIVKEISRINEALEVYDLSVSPFSNFYVFNGESFFLVHNKD